jgi:hypothetical protein
MDPVLAELITLSGFAVRDYMKMDLSQQFVFVNRYADYLEWKMKCEKSSFITLNISSFVLTSTHFLLYPYAYSVGKYHLFRTMPKQGCLPPAKSVYCGAYPGYLWLYGCRW